MPRVIEAFKQFLDGDGNPLVNGKLRFLVSNTNNTDKDTYADISETIANTNPVLLDAEGRCPNVFGTGSYRVISYDSDDQQIQQFDPVPGGTASTGQFTEWQPTAAYSEKEIVEYDGGYYVATDTVPIGEPPTNQQYWEEIRHVYVYNPNVAYPEGRLVLYTDNSVYLVAAATTAGDTPVSEPLKFIPASNVFRNATEYVLDLGTLTGGTVDIDLRIAGVVKATISTAETTLNFTNPPASGYDKKIHFKLTDAGSQVLNLPAGSIWAAGTQPTLTTAGVDHLVVDTDDGGTTWVWSVRGLDFKAAS